MIEKKILAFNVQSGEFLAEFHEQEAQNFNLDELKVKYIEYDTELNSWDGGNYASGKIISKEELSRQVYEISLNQLCRNVIVDEYPIDDQINNITNVLLEVVGVLKLEGDVINKLKDQKAFITECVETNRRYVSAYKNDPHWTVIGKDDELNSIRDAVDKEVAEEIGVHTIDL